MGKIDLSKSTFLILFLAVGFIVGISFSSVYAGIPWGTSEIADDAITSKKILDKQIFAPDIHFAAVKSNKIKDGTIISADIANGQVMPVDVGFNYAGSSSKGGAASDVACNGCVSGGAILDGTITNADLPFSIKFKTILDDAAGNAAGWDPDGVAQFFQIDDDDVTQNSYVIVGIGAGGTTFFDSCETTVLRDTHPIKDFQIMLCPVIANGFPMRYMIITP